MEVQCADCVLAGDGNVQAVVLYTDQATNTSCNLAWLDAKDAGVVYHRRSGQSESGPAGFYTGGWRQFGLSGQGQVSLDVEETATGDRYRYTVSCGEEGPSRALQWKRGAVPERGLSGSQPGRNTLAIGY